jgi:hypothetical protein
MIPMLRRPVLALLALLPALSAPLAGQKLPSRTFQYPLRLVDLAIESSTGFGVGFYAAPSVQSKQGADSLRFMALNFHPDTLLDWLDQAGAVLRRPAVVEREKRIQWTRLLRATRGEGFLSIGREVKNGKLLGSRWLAVRNKDLSWSLELSGSEADSLLQLLMVAGMQAGVADSALGLDRTDSVDTPVRVQHQPIPRYRGLVGRAFARFVVGVDGKVEPGTLIFLLASSPELAEEARWVLLESRFHPAMIRGRPVRQLVQQVIAWKPR